MYFLRLSYQGCFNNVSCAYKSFDCRILYMYWPPSEVQRNINASTILEDVKCLESNRINKMWITLFKTINTLIPRAEESPLSNFAWSVGIHIRESQRNSILQYQDWRALQLLNSGGLKHPKQVSVYLPMTECNLISEQENISRSCKLILQQATSKKCW